MSAKQTINTRGIELSACYLENSGSKVIEREWKCESGIADLIVKENDELAFVQVNARRASAAGLPEDVVTKSTRSKFELLALNYLSTHNLPSCRVRFDIISILLADDNKAFLKHHRDALATGA
jgi:putative endonuclease